VLRPTYFAGTSHKHSPPTSEQLSYSGILSAMSVYVHVQHILGFLYMKFELCLTEK